MSPADACKRILLPLFLPYTLFIGCSAVGMLAGSIGSPARDGRVTARSGLDSIPLGTEVNIVRFDRKSFHGEFAGLHPLPPRMYSRAYDTLAAQSAYARMIPKLGQQVTIVTIDGADSGSFRGVMMGEVTYQPPAGLDTVGVPLEEIRWIQAGDSLRLEGSVLRKLVRAGTIPGRTIALMNIDNAQVFIGYETVDIVETMPKSSGALTGFLIGAAVDLTVAILIVSSMNSAESDCKSSQSSCNNSNNANCGSKTR